MSANFNILNMADLAYNLSEPHQKDNSEDNRSSAEKFEDVYNSIESLSEYERLTDFVNQKHIEIDFTNKKQTQKIIKDLIDSLYVNYGQAEQHIQTIIGSIMENQEVEENQESFVKDFLTEFISQIAIHTVPHEIYKTQDDNKTKGWVNELLYECNHHLDILKNVFTLPARLQLEDNNNDKEIENFVNSLIQILKTAGSGNENSKFPENDRFVSGKFIEYLMPYLNKESALRSTVMDKGWEKVIDDFEKNSLKILPQATGKNKMEMIQKIIKIAGANKLINNIEEYDLLFNDEEFEKFVFLVAENDLESFVHYIDRLEIDQAQNKHEIYLSVLEKEPELALSIIDHFKFTKKEKLNIYNRYIQSQVAPALKCLDQFCQDTNLSKKERQDLIDFSYKQLEKRNLSDQEVINNFTNFNLVDQPEINQLITELKYTALDNQKDEVIEKFIYLFHLSDGHKGVQIDKVKQYLQDQGFTVGHSNIMAYSGSHIDVPIDFNENNQEMKMLDQISNYSMVGVRNVFINDDVEVVDPDVYKFILQINSEKEYFLENLALLSYLKKRPELLTTDFEFYKNFFFDLVARLDSHTKYLFSELMVFFDLPFSQEQKQSLIEELMETDFFIDVYLNSKQINKLLTEDQKIRVIERNLVLEPEGLISAYEPLRLKDKKSEHRYFSQKIKEKTPPFDLFDNTAQAISFFQISKHFRYNDDFFQLDSFEDRKARVTEILEMKQKLSPEGFQVAQKTNFKSTLESYQKLEYLAEKNFSSLFPLLTHYGSVISLLKTWTNKQENKKLTKKKKQENLKKFKSKLLPETVKIITKMNISTNFPIECYEVLDSIVKMDLKEKTPEEVMKYEHSAGDVQDLRRLVTQFIPALDKDQLDDINNHYLTAFDFFVHKPKPLGFSKDPKHPRLRIYDFEYQDYVKKQRIDARVTSNEVIERDKSSKKEVFISSSVTPALLLGIQAKLNISFEESYIFFAKLKEHSFLSTFLGEFIVNHPNSNVVPQFLSDNLDDLMMLYKNLGSLSYESEKKIFKLVCDLKLADRKSLASIDIDQVTKGYKKEEVIDLMLHFNENTNFSISDQNHVEIFVKYLNEFSLNESTSFFNEYLGLSQGDSPSMDGTYLGITDKGKIGLNQLRGKIRELNHKFITTPVFDAKKLEIDFENPIVYQYLQNLVRFEEGRWGSSYQNFGDVIIEFEKDRNNGEIEPLPQEYQNFSFQVELGLDEKEHPYVMTETALGKFLSLQSEIGHGLTAINHSEGHNKYFQKELNRYLNEDIKLLQESLDGADESEKKFINKEIHARKELQENVAKNPDQIIKILLDYSVKNKINKSNHYVAQIIRQRLFSQSILSSGSNQKKLREVSAVNETAVDKKALSTLVELIGNEISQHVIPELELTGKQKKKLSKILNTKALREEIRRVNEFHSGKFKEIETVFSRDMLAEFSGYYCDTCWTGQDDIMKNNDTLIGAAFVQNNVLIGGSLFIESISEDGEKVLIIRGVNPRQNYITNLNPGSFVESFCDKLMDVAKARGCAKIVAPVKNTGALSNRPEILDYFDEKYSKEPLVKLGKKEDFNDYNITSSCVTIREIK